MSTKVTSILGGATPDPDPDPALDPYLCCTFEGPLHLHVHSNLCLTLDHVGGSTPDVDPAPDAYLCCTF